MRKQTGLTILLFSIALVSVILTGCNLYGYTTLGVPNPPRAWSTVTVPQPSGRVTWSASQLALNADTWVYADDAGTHGTTNYTRFLTLENPDPDGVGSFLDIEVKDNSGPDYSDYKVRLGVYQLTKGYSNPVNELEMYEEYVFEFRYESQNDPYSMSDGVFGAYYEQPKERFYGLWSLDQATATTMNLDVFGSGAVPFTRLDRVLYEVLNNPPAPPTSEELLARYLQVFLQASQVFHFGWNGHGQGSRAVATIIGSIISSDGIPDFEVKYLSPLGLGQFNTKYQPPTPVIGTRQVEKMDIKADGYQVFSHIIAMVSDEVDEDVWDWELEIISGSGNGKLGGSTEFQVVTFDGGTTVTNHEVVLDFGLISSIPVPPDSSTAVSNMIINSAFDLYIDGVGGGGNIAATTVTPGNLNLTWQ
jgi:hypothetical protein